MSPCPRDQVSRLTASLSDHQHTISSLRSQLEEVREELSSVEGELGRRVAELVPREEGLRVSCDVDHARLCYLEHRNIINGIRCIYSEILSFGW